MKSKNFKTFSVIAILTILCLPIIAGAAAVPWASESYRAYAYTANLGGNNSASDEAFGPPFPVSAYKSMSATQASSYIANNYMTVFASSGSTSEISEAIAEFTGYYIASDPGFIFTYSFPGSIEWSPADGWLTITDMNNSAVLYDYTFSGQATDAGTFSVYTPLGHNIAVNFGIRANASPFNSMENARLNYAMAAVAPEPISSILFVTGGILLAGKRYMRKAA